MSQPDIILRVLTEHLSQALASGSLEAARDYLHFRF